MAAALIGARLREKRLALGLRQAELAEMTGISASYLNLIEHNRRNVTPEVLARLSAALGVELAPLNDGATLALTEDLRRAAALLPQTGAEVDRVEDFLARYPGWAQLVAGLQGRAERLERTVDLLNDRLSHDPQLSAALHEVLSAISGVRATAEILAETKDLSSEWQDRFHHNLHQDSERLAHGASQLIAFLDRPADESPAAILSPQEEVEHWLAARGWQLPEGEAALLQEEIARLATAPARILARGFLAQWQEDQRLLPLGPLREAMARLGLDPALLAQHFGASVLAVMRRIALLPEVTAGLVITDGAGSMLFRKPLDGFALPRFGAGCALWPVFSALARPGLPLRLEVETNGMRFTTLSIGQSFAPFGFAGPDLRQAAMLILPDAPPGGSPIPVGSSCRICPREACPARCEPSLIAPPRSAFDRRVKKR